MKKLLIGLTLLASMSSFGAKNEKEINIESAYMCMRTHINTDVDLTMALSSIGIDAYDIQCDDNYNLSFYVIFDDLDVLTDVEIDILEEEKDGYYKFYVAATERTISKALYSLGYKASFRNVVRKGKSHNFSRFLNEINPLNIPGVLFPGVFAVKDGKRDEDDTIIGQKVVLKRFRNN